MNSSAPYLIRAINEWILDNDCTPYLIVDISIDGVSVPREFAKDGQIVLNISPMATRHLLIANEGISFSGRFAGVAHEIVVPIDAVLGIVAKENGEGMWFPRDEDGKPPEPPSDPGGDDGPKKKGPPELKVVK
ncbi:MAG: ClpXP protease specificity-enhancing factor [Pseudomonadales bacterium]|nr:ClpXP protease specificity-enhancing factor [Pseudomonadales bacterium]